MGFLLRIQWCIICLLCQRCIERMATTQIYPYRKICGVWATEKPCWKCVYTQPGLNGCPHYSFKFTTVLWNWIGREPKQNIAFLHVVLMAVWLELHIVTHDVFFYTVERDPLPGIEVMYLWFKSYLLYICVQKSPWISRWTFLFVRSKDAFFGTPCYELFI